MGACRENRSTTSQAKSRPAGAASGLLRSGPEPAINNGFFSIDSTSVYLIDAFQVHQGRPEAHASCSRVGQTPYPDESGPSLCRSPALSEGRHPAREPCGEVLALL